MRLTARQLNRATLARQLLLRREKLGAVEALRAVCALQAQSPASPYIGLWNRVADFDPIQLDRAFAEHHVVKATLMRITLQAVAAEDYPAFHSAMVYDLRRSRLFDTRFKSAGLSIEEADALAPDVLAFAAKPRTNQQVEAMLRQRLPGDAGTWTWWAMRTFGRVVHAPTGGPWSFGDRPSYRASPHAGFEGSVEEALAILLRRYLAAFGPASGADFNQFTMLPQPRFRAALEILGDELVTHEGPDGKPLHDVPDAPLPSDETPAPPRLMAMWDNTLLAHRDRSRIIPEAYRKLVIRTNGDTLPTVLVDGYVAGVWRPAPEREGAIEVTAFHKLAGAAWDELEPEARSLADLLAVRQATVYSRYARWWTALPAAEVRVLAT